MRLLFGECALDPARRELRRGDRPVHLEPQVFDLLLHLIQNRDRVVSRGDLLSAVWRGRIVSESTLSSRINAARNAVGDSGERQLFIRTVARRGLRFVGEVRQEAYESTGRDTDGMSAAGARDEKPSIAVLPLVDMSPGRDQDYLCEGLAEELINALTKIEGLRVAARTASFQFREAGADVHEVGGRLGVGSLLEGSVRKAADRLRITVQLIDVATGYHRWSQRFDRMLDDIFAIQDEIAESVATALRGSVLSRRDKEALQQPQTNVEAYECYLRGRQHLPRMTRPDLEKSREMFERAIGLDPEYGPAWAGLAVVHATLYEWFGAQADDLSRAEQASRRALQAAQGLAESHVARGFVLSLSQRYDEAGTAFEDAIRINPNLFDAYYYFARTAFAQGNVARSAELFRKAAEVRREDFQSPSLLAQSLRMLGRETEAREANQEAIKRAEHILTLNPADGRALSLGSCSLFEDGQTERALAWSRRSLELDPEDMSALINSACLHAKAGLKNQALDLLERVFARGWGKRDWVEHDPDYDSLRDDPRFKKLLCRLK